MNNRIETVRHYVDDILNHSHPAEDCRIAYLHTYSVASICSMIAGKRELDCEIAFIIGLLHDIYAYRTGIHPFHSHNSAEMARPMIRDMKLFDDEEQAVILSAVYHHDDKQHVHDEYDELIKDADLLQHYLVDPSRKTRNPEEMKRLKNLTREFGIGSEHMPDEIVPKIAETKPGRRKRLAEIAEEFAWKRVCGKRTDKGFLGMIRHFPEETAFDELKNAWCAAFVYHCCMEAGFTLPIRPPHTSCRLAGVIAWYEWGNDNGFCFSADDGFVPEAGDIVIYDDIIPRNLKPKDSSRHDHIGIILKNEGNSLLVAEGNINNRNCSGIMERNIDETIGCFIRIPDDYVYDGWKFDYKTRKERVVDYR